MAENTSSRGDRRETSEGVAPNTVVVTRSLPRECDADSPTRRDAQHPRKRSRGIVLTLHLHRGGMQQPEGEPAESHGAFPAASTDASADHGATKRPISSCAGTGAQCAVAGFGVHAARVARVSSRTAGTAPSRRCASSARTVSRGRAATRTRYGSPAASSASTIGPMISRSQRSSASTLMSARPWCPASSVASTCNTNRSRSSSESRHARACAP